MAGLENPKGASSNYGPWLVGLIDENLFGALSLSLLRAAGSMPGAVQWALGDQGLGGPGSHDAPEGCLSSPSSSPPSPGPSSSPFGPRVRGSGKVYISSMFGVWEFRKVKAALFLLRERHCILHGTSEFVAVPHSALKGCLLPRTSTLIWPSSHDGIM